MALLAQAIKDFLNTQAMGTPFDVKAGEVEVPTSDHGHAATGTGNSYILLHDASNFQLFRSPDPVLTFIDSNHNTASYWGGGDRTIYDFGHGNTLRFSELESAKVDIFGFDHDLTGKVVVFNTALTTIQSDGNGGTLVGNLDFHNAIIDPSRVSFMHADAQLSTGGLVPL